ncbi:hypothetical protein BLNAU_2610 [Blattamonas nauphoetae]|uniref:Uncharacterized protein n=1 Tax=Blattamonas nauphoetae TaxID=2049346 RepID=A0ABQ9YF22_9EUKA|nr:hypothetical protein BLNAU_2610 [Blattamonas nauphoetae]
MTSPPDKSPVDEELDISMDDDAAETKDQNIVKENDGSLTEPRPDPQAPNVRVITAPPPRLKKSKKVTQGTFLVIPSDGQGDEIRVEEQEYKMVDDSSTEDSATRIKTPPLRRDTHADLRDEVRKNAYAEYVEPAKPKKADQVDTEALRAVRAAHSKKQVEQQLRANGQRRLKERMLERELRRRFVEKTRSTDAYTRPYKPIHSKPLDRFQSAIVSADVSVDLTKLPTITHSAPQNENKQSQSLALRPPIAFSTNPIANELPDSLSLHPCISHPLSFYPFASSLSVMPPPPDPDDKDAKPYVPTRGPHKLSFFSNKLHPAFKRPPPKHPLREMTDDDLITTFLFKEYTTFDSLSALPYSVVTDKKKAKALADVPGAVFDTATIARLEREELEDERLRLQHRPAPLEMELKMQVAPFFNPAITKSLLASDPSTKIPKPNTQPTFLPISTFLVGQRRLFTNQYDRYAIFDDMQRLGDCLTEASKSPLSILPRPPPRPKAEEPPKQEEEEEEEKGTIEEIRTRRKKQAQQAYAPSNLFKPPTREDLENTAKSLRGDEFLTTRKTYEKALSSSADEVAKILKNHTFNKYHFDQDRLAEEQKDDTAGFDPMRYLNAAEGGKKKRQALVGQLLIGESTASKENANTTRAWRKRRKAKGLYDLELLRRELCVLMSGVVRGYVGVMEEVAARKKAKLNEEVEKKMTEMKPREAKKRHTRIVTPEMEYKWKQEVDEVEDKEHSPDIYDIIDEEELTQS